MDDKLVIGIILKPQGIRGELKLKSLCDGLFAIKNLRQVTVDGIVYPLLKARQSGEDLYIVLGGVEDRNTAETLRNKEVFASKTDITLKENTYFIVDIIGLELYTDDGTEIGVITDIRSLKTDVYYVQTPKGECSFPMIDKLNKKVDLNAHRMTVDAKSFNEVAYYED